MEWPWWSVTGLHAEGPLCCVHPDLTSLLLSAASCHLWPSGVRTQVVFGRRASGGAVIPERLASSGDRPTPDTPRVPCHSNFTTHEPHLRPGRAAG